MAGYDFNVEPFSLTRALGPAVDRMEQRKEDIISQQAALGDENALARIASRNPQQANVLLDLMGSRQAREAETLAQQARFGRVDPRQLPPPALELYRKYAGADRELVGRAAAEILMLPEEQRQSAWVSKIQELSAQGVPMPRGVESWGADKLRPLAASVVGDKELGNRVFPEREKPTQTDREISSLTRRGIPRELAEDIAYGNVSVETDDFGNIFTVNKATGEVQTLSAGNGQRRDEPSTPEPQGPDLRRAADEGTGPVGNIRAGINAVIGPFVAGVPFEDTETARNQLRNFNQAAKTALVNNPRFPVAEQKTVQDLLPDPGRFFQDPDAARQKLDDLQSFLQQKIDQIDQSLERGSITTKERGALSDQKEAINRILGLFGGDSQDLPEGVPQGSQPAGTSKSGNPVYRTQDGRLLEVTP